MSRPRISRESWSGIALVSVTMAALVAANLGGGHAYEAFREFDIGPRFLGLHLSIERWADDGILAIFFFVIGLELKREFTVGSLNKVRLAIVPMIAAVGGMVMPALIFSLINGTQSSGDMRGWATPVATDIAFAVAALAMVSRGLPRAIRSFLLTLAVVDDLLGVLAIALFYSHGFSWGYLAAAAGAVVLFAVASRWQAHWWPLLVVIGIIAWYLMFRSGVHATIAGVLCGLVVPTRAPRQQSEASKDSYGLRFPSPCARFEHYIEPVSTWAAVPFFAFVTAGVELSGHAISSAIHDPVAQGIALGLILGKPLGIFGATFLLVKLTSARLSAELRWGDVIAVGILGGIGFTVSLLIGTLAFGPGTSHMEHATIAVLFASAIAAIAGMLALRVRARAHS